MLNFSLLDGGMGQILIQRSKRPLSESWSANVLVHEPDLVEQLHYEFLQAGADIITTNSYTLHRDRLRPHDLEDQLELLLINACDLAHQAVTRAGKGKIAGSIGPTPRSYRPDLAPPLEKAAELYAEIAAILAPRVDVLLCETMASIDQTHGALLGICTTETPVWLAATVDDEDGTKLRSGEPLQDLIPLIKQFQPEALLLNCSLPEAVAQGLSVIANQGITIGCYANGFTGISKAFLKPGATVESLKKNEKLTPKAYAEWSKQWLKQGASIIGGCCEIGPGHTAAMHQLRSSTE